MEVVLSAMPGRTILFGILLFSLLVVSGCNQVTSENYDQLKIGMPYEAVVDLLGKPDSCEAAIGFKSCTWGGKEKQINIKFGGNSVVFFSSKGI